LFHYSLEKGLVAQITKGDWLVTDILGFNERKRKSILLLQKKLL
jgi:dipeptidyl-peptidase-4